MLVEYDDNPEIIVYEDKDIPEDILNNRDKSLKIVDTMCGFNDTNWNI